MRGEDPGGMARGSADRGRWTYVQDGVLDLVPQKIGLIDEVDFLTSCPVLMLCIAAAGRPPFFSPRAHET